MGLIVVKEKLIESNVYPELKNYFENISTIKTNFRRIQRYIPADFEYARYINSLKGELEKASTLGKQIKKDIEKNLEKCEKIEKQSSSKLEEMLNLLNNLGNNSDDSLNGKSYDAKNISSIEGGFKELLNRIFNKDSKVFENTGATIAANVTASDSIFGVILGDISNGTFLKKTGATIANSFVSLTKGIVNLVESIGDCALMVGAGIATTATCMVDLAEGITTGEFEWNTTKKLWDNTRAIVSTEYTNQLYDKFYDTSIGSKIDDLSYFKKDGTACQIIEGVGYIGGVIALTALTCGTFGIAQAGTLASVSVGSVSATVTTGSVVSAGIATVAGIGKNTSAAWNDGASTVNGILYGTTKGLYEGFEMGLGYTIGSLKVVNGSGVASQVINSASHVALDTLDGASGALVDPMFSMIYAPNANNIEDIMQYVNYDANGNQINNKSWDELSFGEKYNAIFEYNGGWNTVKTQAAMAGVTSALSEVPDVKSVYSASKLAKDINTNGITEQTIKTASSFKGNTLNSFIEQLNENGNIKSASEVLTQTQIKTALPDLDIQTSKNLISNLDDNVVKDLASTKSIPNELLNDEYVNNRITKIVESESNAKLVSEVEPSYKELEDAKISPQTTVETTKITSERIEDSTVSLGTMDTQIRIVESTNKNLIEDLDDGISTGTKNFQTSVESKIDINTNAGVIRNFDSTDKVSTGINMKELQKNAQEQYQKINAINDTTKNIMSDLENQNRITSSTALEIRNLDDESAAIVMNRTLNMPDNPTAINKVIDSVDSKKMPGILKAAESLPGYNKMVSSINTFQAISVFRANSDDIIKMGDYARNMTDKQVAEALNKLISTGRASDAKIVDTVMSQLDNSRIRNMVSAGTLDPNIKISSTVNPNIPNKELIHSWQSLKGDLSGGRTNLSRQTCIELSQLEPKSALSLLERANANTLRPDLVGIITKELNSDAMPIVLKNINDKALYDKVVSNLNYGQVAETLKAYNSHKELFDKFVSKASNNQIGETIHRLSGDYKLTNQFLEQLDSSRIHSMINDGSLKYYPELPKEIRHDIVVKVNEADRLFQHYNHGNNMYGVDQGINRINQQTYTASDILVDDVKKYANYLIEEKSYDPIKAYKTANRLAHNKDIVINSKQYEEVLNYYIRDNRIDEVVKINRSLTGSSQVQQYRIMVDNLKAKGISGQDAHKILKCIDSTGSCTYAAFANSIVKHYEGRPDLFEADFGFKLYTEINGVKEINSAELMTDIYTYINSDECGGLLFKYNNGKVSINNKYIIDGDLDSSRQQYLAYSNGGQPDLIRKYLEHKNPNIKYYHHDYVFDEIQRSGIMRTYNADQLKTEIINKMQDNWQVKINVFPTRKHSFKIIGENKRKIFEFTPTENPDAGHAMYVTGVSSNYIIVSTWGKKAYIPLADFFENKYLLEFVRLER